MGVAAIGAAALALTAVLTFDVPGVGNFDAQALNAMWLLQTPHTVNTVRAITNSVNAVPFAVAVAVLVGLALHTRQQRLVPRMVILVLGANLSTEALKTALPGHNPIVDGIRLETVASFPSGHATAAMSLALCVVLLTPCRGRIAMACLAAMYALAVGYSVVVLASHFSTDVIAGYLMAGIWAALALTGPPISERRNSRPERIETARNTQVLALAGVAVLACTAGVLAAVLTPNETSAVTLLVAITMIAAVGVVVVAAISVLSALGLARAAGARGTAHSTTPCVFKPAVESGVPPAPEEIRS